MSKLSKWKEKIESWMSAVAFAEANEPDKALELAGLEAQRGRSFSLESLTTAITFAEANEHGIAREYLGLKPEASTAKDDLLDIPGIKVWFGKVSMSDPLDLPGVRVWSGTVAVNGA